MEGRKNNKLIAVILIILIVVIIGAVLYTNFIKKDNEQRGNDNTSKEINLTFKTSDGSKVLRVIDINNQDSKNKEKDLLNKNLEFERLDYKYYGEYNGKLLGLFEEEENGVFNLYYGDIIGDTSPRNRYYFFVDKKTNNLINLNYEEENKPLLYWYEKIGNTYYITLGGKSDPITIMYDLKANEIASFYITKDNDTFYAIKDNYITKFKEDGSIIKTGTIKINGNVSKGFIFNNNLYILINDDGIVYLYDFNSDKKYELGSISEYDYCKIGEQGCEVNYFEKISDTEIKITLPSVDRNESKTLKYTLNITTNQLKK